MKTLKLLTAAAALVALAANLSCVNQEKGSGKSITEIDGLKMSELANVWKFKTDPNDVGLKEKWYTRQTDDSGWAEVHSDKDTGWESQGFPGYTGYGWYRQQVKVPGDMDEQKPFYLCFAAVDEDAEVYINGEKAFEHTVISTGLRRNDIWVTPFAFDARKWLKAGQENLIAVRVYNLANRGGIWKPAYFITSDTEVTVGQIAEMVEKKLNVSDARGPDGPGLVMRKGSYEVPEGVLDTGELGGVQSPTAEELADMQKGQYIFHARDGKLTKIQVEKSTLPHDPEGHVQIVATVVSPDGVVYVNQGSLICKSTDGGRTWTSHPRGDWGGSLHNGSFQILGDGTFIAVPEQRSGPAKVMVSRDEGRSWSQRSEFSAEVPGYDFSCPALSMFRFPDDTVTADDDVLLYTGRWDRSSGDPHAKILMSRSEDGGFTWSSLYEFHEQSVEGGITLLPSGRLLASARYQRSLRPDDPPDLLERNGLGPGYSPYKHLFLLDSDDSGRSWKNFRQLTAVFGQCYGYPAALDDGTVVVIHDTRLGPGVPGGRAMISRDEGKTWQDEAYYTHYGTGVSGYSQSVVLEDGVILTIVGTSDHPDSLYSFDAAVGQSDLTAIRWKPVKE